VLEDLDTLVDEKSRSYFLNQMDGFSANRGILTVATTNHPEKLDPAILDRPSRFDRKITFSLPELPERRAFLALANERRPVEQRLSSAELDRVARRTEGFSFAYLKELSISAAMAWMRERRPGTMCHLMLAQVDALLSQMRTEAQPKERQGEDEEEETLASLI
jgi:ATP-dependent 26S proteasome regulatory subunit